ncbi:MAG: hypothetical protein QJR09_05180 [Micrococcus sp.]|nr:hypothetical protein [Micrococcus sp.]
MTVMDGHPEAEARKAQNRAARDKGEPIICTTCGDRLDWIPNDAERVDLYDFQPAHVYHCARCSNYWGRDGLPVLTPEEWKQWAAQR